MQTSAIPHGRVVPARSSSSGAPVALADSTMSTTWFSSRCASLHVDERVREMQGVAIPCAEILLVVRFGPSTPRGFEVHSLGVRERVHRKLVRGGQRVVTARLPLGAQEAVLGVPASAIAGRPVPLEELWGDAERRRLFERIADARTSLDVAAILDRVIAERLALAKRPRAHADLAVHAAAKLANASVSEVATALRVSERNLRRVFQDTVGVGPKTFARLERFRRALGAARAQVAPRWATIAVDTGYYDQAHLIAEFRAIAGVTPQALLGEMRAGIAIG